jgi:hypothetical protein
MGGKRPSGGGGGDAAARALALATLAGAATTVAAQTDGADKACAIGAAFLLIGWAALIVARR